MPLSRPATSWGMAAAWAARGSSTRAWASTDCSMRCRAAWPSVSSTWGSPALVLFTQNPAAITAPPATIRPAAAVRVRPLSFIVGSVRLTELVGVRSDRLQLGREGHRRTTGRHIDPLRRGLEGGPPQDQLAAADRHRGELEGPVGTNLRVVATRHHQHIGAHLRVDVAEDLHVPGLGDHHRAGLLSGLDPAQVEGVPRALGEDVVEHG